MLFRLSIECPDLHGILQEFEKLNHILSHLVGPPKPVGSPIFILISELNDMLNYNVSLPVLPDVPEAADVIGGVLTLSVSTPVEGGDPTVEERVIPTAVGQEVIEGVSFEQNSTVNGSFVFVDDAGNLSTTPVLVVEFVALDTIAPPSPEGGVGFTLVSEG